MNPRSRGLGETSRVSSRSGAAGETRPRSGSGRPEAAGPGGSYIPEQQGISSPGEKSRRVEVQSDQKRPATPAAAAGLGFGPGQPVSQAGANQGSAPVDPPPALRELIAFLQSFPGGSLEIPPEQAPAVSSYLIASGLPQEEVNRLLASSGTQGATLSATDLTAAWQRVAAQGSAAAGCPGQGRPAPGSEQVSQAQDLRRTPEYRALWERLTLPRDMLPTLRLALARLGGSPEVLARVEEEGQAQGVSLAKVWEILQNVGDSMPRNDAENAGGASPEAVQSQADLLGQRQVMSEELKEWGQVLLKAGFPPAVVEKLLGRRSPGNQEELKTTLLALAPVEEPPPAPADPKPLFLPPSLQARAFFWQAQTEDRPHLDGNGPDVQGQTHDALLAGYSQADTSEETVNPASFPAQLLEFVQGLPNPGAPLSGASGWGPFTPEIRESLWSQLQSGVIANLAKGENRVILNLNPPELGQVQLTLHLSGQELAVTAVATRPEVAELATLGVPQLLHALAQQGLVLTQFQVRLPDQPGGQITPVQAGARDKGGASGGGNVSTSTRRRTGEVDRFV